MILSKRFAILTCGGVCPGMNDVTRSITLHSYRRGVVDVYGVPFGFRGLQTDSIQHKQLAPSIVKHIHHRGGTFLGTSRDALRPDLAIDSLIRHNYGSLFVIGGNGGNMAASILQDAINDKGIDISVIALPKSIDNDIDLIDKCFGFQTAVHEAKKVLSIARNEADAVPSGIVIVKVMGRDSGFIAHYASIHNDDVDICLIPEHHVSRSTIFDEVSHTLTTRGSCVVCIAEGFDIPAHTLFDDIKTAFTDSYCKFIDPSYILRGGTTVLSDHIYCNLLGEWAVDAALTGKKGVTVATKHGVIEYFSTKDIVRKTKKVN